MRPMPSRSRPILALALVAGTLVTAGCYTPGGRYASRDQFTYASTPLQPQTITVFDARTNEAIWSQDVPVGQKLVIRFFDGRGSGEGNFPALMRWEVMDDDRSSGRLANELAVPLRDARRVEVTLRDAPEYPDASGDGLSRLDPTFTLPPAELIASTEPAAERATEPVELAVETPSAEEPIEVAAADEIVFVDGVPQVQPMMVRTGDVSVSVMSAAIAVEAPRLRGVTVPIQILSETAAQAATVAAMQARQSRTIASKIEMLRAAIAAGAEAALPFTEPFGMDQPARDLPVPPGEGSVADVVVEPEFFDEFGLYPERAAPVRSSVTAQQAGPADPADLPLPTGTPPSQIRPAAPEGLDSGDLLDD